MFTEEDSRQAVCERHGDYTDKYIDYGPLGKRWTGCELCADEQRKEKERLEKIEEDKVRRQEWIEGRLKVSGIPKKFKTKTFGNFEPVNEKAKARKAAIMEYVDLVCSGDHEGRSLIMVGKLGNGKTHLACAMLSEMIRRTAMLGKYATFSEVVRRVKASWKNDSEESESGVYYSLSKPDVLVIDEVGMQNFTEFEQVVAYEVVNARYLEEKPTVIITNLAAKDLSSVMGERVVDRLRENGGKALDFDWDSYRAGGKNDK